MTTEFVKARWLAGPCLALWATLAWPFAYTGQGERPSVDRLPVPNQTTGVPLVWPTARAAALPFAVGSLEPEFQQSARAAMAAWSGVGSRLQMQATGAAGAPCDPRSRINTIAMRPALCDGSPFDDALAITQISFQYDPDRGEWVLVHAEVLLDQTRAWAPARAGPPRQSPLDFQRVILHELGHAVGLDHPDEAGQEVEAIMNSRLSRIDRLQPDDGEGMTFLYRGPERGEENGGGGSGALGLAEVVAGLLFLLGAKIGRRDDPCHGQWARRAWRLFACRAFPYNRATSDRHSHEPVADAAEEEFSRNPRAGERPRAQ